MEARWSNFGQVFSDCAKEFSSEIAVSSFRNNQWECLTYTELERAVARRAKALVLAGFSQGTKIALLSATSTDSIVLLCGALVAGVTITPLDSKATEGEHSEILKRLQPKGLYVSREFLERGLNLARDLGIEKVLLIEDEVANYFSADAIVNGAQPSDLAAIFFTSGTLGAPKGVLVSYGSLLFELTSLSGLKENHKQDTIFSILPINHIYGVTAGFLYAFVCGCEYVVAHSLAPEEIGRALRDRRVTQMTAVPLLMSVMRRGISAKIQEQPPLRRRLVSLFLALGPYLPMPVRRKLFSAIHNRLGGSLARVVCGAAPLDSITERFFRAIGIPIYVGYGLTETGPVVSVNTTRKYQKGSVGQILPGVEVRIQRDNSSKKVGEIQVRGPNVMAGYFLDAEATKEAISSEGWFRTGDLGFLSGTYLYIGGRTKSLIVLGSGKKVHPEEVEVLIGNGGQFSENCVLGIPLPEQGEQVVAVVYPSEEFRKTNSDNLEKAAEEEVLRICRKLAPYKRPAKVFVSHEPLPKTTSQKVRRNEMKEWVFDRMGIES
jgi:long-chain acyl-CoA synthetase